MCSGSSNSLATGQGRRRIRIIIAALTVLCVFILFPACTHKNQGDDSSNAADDTAGDDTDQGVPPGALDDCNFRTPIIPHGCDDCHGTPPVSSRHPPNNKCWRCHGNVVDEDLHFVNVSLHKNGTVDYSVGCNSCHGWDTDVSPSQNLKGECGIEKSGNGAHKAMRFASIPANSVNCTNCHKVPLTTWEKGHIDGDNKSEIVFSNLATMNGAKPVWNDTTKTCSGVYCHGATLTGGTLKEPNFYDASHKAGQCGACHRLTDPSGNTGVDCHSCHPTTVAEDGTLIPRGTHLNGVIDMADKSKNKRGGK
jgi:predicted CxxxxCH...CXXCH cytochrome family protein